MYYFSTPSVRRIPDGFERRIRIERKEKILGVSFQEALHKKAHFVPILVSLYRIFQLQTWAVVSD
jgi:hypothetical protein